VSRIARAAGVVSAATLVSRLLGLGRDAVRAALVGASTLSDAINIAFLLPNLLRDLFAEGAFNGAFVPTIARTRERQGEAAAFALLNRVLSTMLVYVGVLVVAIVLGAPLIVDLLTSDEFAARPGAVETAVLLVRILAPFLLLISLAVAAAGTLNVHGRFFVPALSPATQNLLLVAGGAVLLGIGRTMNAAAVPWAFLLLGGGLLQFAIQVPQLWALGWRPRFHPDLRLALPETRQIVRRMLPVVGGMAATHISILVNNRLATGYEGGVSNLYYAFRLVHLPVGLVGVALGTAVLAEASRRAAAEDHAGVLAALRESLLMGLALTAPAAAGLLVLGEPIARLLYQHGETLPGQAAAIGTTIVYYAPAVIFYAAVKVVTPVFYAQGRVRIPLFASLAGVTANLACALTTNYATDLQWRGLALALGAGQMANLAVLLLWVRRIHGVRARGVWPPLLRILGASAACGLAAWATVHAIPDAPRIGVRALRALLPVGVGGAVYLAAGHLLGSREIRRALSWRSLRLDKGAPRP